MLDNKYIKSWEENKEKVKEELNTKLKSGYFDGGYIDIVKSIVNHVLNAVAVYEIEKYDADKITVIDDGEYQGSLIFAIPSKCYQPSPYEYIFCYAYYGSCSGCDALLAATYIEDIMQIALHIFQSMKFLWSFDENIDT